MAKPSSYASFHLSNSNLLLDWDQLGLRIFRTFGLGFANRNLGLLTLRRGGGGGIRTHETLSGLTVFKTAAFNQLCHPSEIHLVIVTYSKVLVPPDFARVAFVNYSPLPFNPKGERGSAGEAVTATEDLGKKSGA